MAADTPAVSSDRHMGGSLEMFAGGIALFGGLTGNMASMPAEGNPAGDKSIQRRAAQIEALWEEVANLRDPERKTPRKSP